MSLDGFIRREVKSCSCRNHSNKMQIKIENGVCNDKVTLNDIPVDHLNKGLILKNCRWFVSDTNLKDVPLLACIILSPVCQNKQSV